MAYLEAAADGVVSFSGILGRMSACDQRLAPLTAGLPPSYWFLWMGTIINRLGGFVVPFLSLYLTSERGVPITRAGLMVALFGAGSFAAQLVGGELADRLGRRPVLLLSLLVTLRLRWPSVSRVSFRHRSGHDRGSWILHRPVPAGGERRRIRPGPAGRTRPRAFGYMYWAINLGARLAPIIAGFMAHVDYLLLFAGDALTTLLYGCLCWHVSRDLSRRSRSCRAGVGEGAPGDSWARNRCCWSFTFLTLIFGTIYMQGIVTLPLDMQQHGLGPADYGLAIAANGILIVLVTIQLSRLVVRWPRSERWLWLPWHWDAASAEHLGHDPACLRDGVVVWTVGEIIGASVAPTIIADLAPVELRGLYQGVFGSAWGLSFFIGPIVGTWAFEAFSPDVLWIGCGVRVSCLLRDTCYWRRPATGDWRLARQIEAPQLGIHGPRRRRLPGCVIIATGRDTATPGDPIDTKLLVRWQVTHRGPTAS